jgi:acyl-CoA synthetase (NDP forming)
VLERPAGIDEARARRLVDRWRAVDPLEHELTVDRRVELLGCYGIPVLEYRVARSADEAVTGAGDIGYPVVVKVADETFRHRDDRIGVRVGLADAGEVADAYTDLAALGDPTCYVQAMAARDRATVSTVCGVRADPSFGALVWFGLGGMATELLDDRAYRAVPLTDVDAADLIDGPRAAPLLHGYRGSEPVSVPALRDLALRLSALADDLPEIIELTLRPVLAGPAGISVTGTAGRLGPPPRYLDATRRMR